MAADRLGAQIEKLRIVIQNTTRVDAATIAERDALLLRACVSTHAILRIAGGRFVSLLEPPPDLAGAAAECRNVGLWPVLAGEPGSADRVLASPIIFYDYPQVAPESPAIGATGPRSTKCWPCE